RDLRRTRVHLNTEREGSPQKNDERHSVIHAFSWLPPEDGSHKFLLQNVKRAASWIRRALCVAPVSDPNVFAFVSAPVWKSNTAFLFTSVHSSVLNALYSSARSCRRRVPPTGIFLNREMSQFMNPGPRYSSYRALPRRNASD